MVAQALRTSHDAGVLPGERNSPQKIENLNHFFCLLKSLSKTPIKMIWEFGIYCNDKKKEECEKSKTHPPSIALEMYCIEMGPPLKAIKRMGPPNKGLVKNKRTEWEPKNKHTRRYAILILPGRGAPLDSKLFYIILEQFQNVFFNNHPYLEPMFVKIWPNTVSSTSLKKSSKCSLPTPITPLFLNKTGVKPSVPSVL